MLFREAISEQERFCHKKDNHIMFPIYNQSSMSYVSRLNSKKYAQGLWFLRLDQIYYFLMYTFVRFFLSFMSAYIFIQRIHKMDGSSRVIQVIHQETPITLRIDLSYCFSYRAYTQVSYIYKKKCMSNSI